MVEKRGKIFNKVMVVPDGPDTWMAALCRGGFETQEDGMKWALEYLNPNESQTTIDELYHEAINDALNGID